MCLPLTAHIITLWPRLSCLLCVYLSIPTLFCSLLANVYLLCLSGSLLCLCSTADVLYSSTNNVFFLWSLQHSDLGCSVCLPTTLCCLLVCHCMLRAGRVDVKGWSSCRQVRRGCMASAGRSVFWCPLVGAESDSCGRMAGGRVSFSDTTGYMY